MKKKKWFGYAMTGILTAGIIGGIGTTAFAAATAETNTVKQTMESLDDATKEKMQEIKEQLKTQLADLGVTLPERSEKENRFANLDEDTKEKAEAIMEKEKAGTITHEEAKTQLEEMGVTLPERKGKGKMGEIFNNLDDATKAKAEAIFEKEKAGTITHDEAKAQLEELGVNVPKHGGKGKLENLLTNLDEETKTKAQDLIDQAQAELEELGVTHPKL